MKLKFLTKSLLFLAIFAAIMLLLNQRYIDYIRENKQIFRQENEWQANKAPLEFTIFGDSHAHNAINPAHLPNSFNFANGGEDYVETYYKFEKLLQETEIDTIILEIDTHSFSEKLRTNERLFDEFTYYSDFIPLATMRKLKDQSQIRAFIAKHLPVIGKGEELLYLIFPPELTTMYRGWTEKSEDFSQLSAKSRERAASSRATHHFIKEKQPVGLLEARSLSHFIKILKLAEERNIRIALIKYPVTPEYDQQISQLQVPQDHYYDELFRTINDHEINYLLLDYYDLYFEKPEYFSDSDHLNTAGAKALSEKINIDLNS